MDEEEKYAVPKSVLTAIADRTRVMAGTTEGMTLDEIIYWLGRVVYIPQGWASCSSQLILSDGGSSAIGILPTVYRGVSNSSQLILSDGGSSAIGILEEV